MKTKELNERELQRVCGGAFARGEDGVGQKHGGKRATIRRGRRLFDAPHPCTCPPPPPPPDPPSWKLLGRIL